MASTSARRNATNSSPAWPGPDRRRPCVPRPRSRGMPRTPFARGRASRRPSRRRGSGAVVRRGRGRRDFVLGSPPRLVVAHDEGAVGLQVDAVDLPRRRATCARRRGRRRGARRGWVVALAAPGKAEADLEVGRCPRGRRGFAGEPRASRSMQARSAPCPREGDARRAALHEACEGLLGQVARRPWFSGVSPRATRRDGAAHAGSARRPRGTPCPLQGIETDPVLGLLDGLEVEDSVSRR